jgi:hypothetical protein
MNAAGTATLADAAHTSAAASRGFAYLQQALECNDGTGAGALSPVRMVRMTHAHTQRSNTDTLPRTTHTHRPLTHTQSKP